MKVPGKVLKVPEWRKHSSVIFHSSFISTRHLYFQENKLTCFDVWFKAKCEPRSLEAGREIKTSKAREKSKQSRLGGGLRNSLIELIAEVRRGPWLQASLGAAPVLP